jgi:hypothetical protein
MQFRRPTFDEGIFGPDVFANGQEKPAAISNAIFKKFGQAVRFNPR